MLINDSLTSHVVTKKESEKISSAYLWRNFGSWIRSHREARGKTQAEVAKAVNKHVVQISRIENGESGTKRDTVLLLAYALNIDPFEALEQAGFKAPAPDGGRDGYAMSDLSRLYFKHSKIKSKARQKEFERIWRMIERDYDRELIEQDANGEDAV